MDSQSVSATINGGSIERPNSGPTRRRYWPQYSLRATMIALTIVTVALGWLGIQVEHARRQRSAIEAMNYVTVRYNYELDTDDPDNPSVLDVPSPVPAFVRRICGENIFADAVSLATQGAYFDAANLNHLSSLRSLLWLYIYADERKVRDSDLTTIGELSRLKELEIPCSEVTDLGLQQLAGLTELEALDLSYSEITGTGLWHLRNCKRLRKLRLSGAPLTDAGAHFIRIFPDIEELSVVRITDTCTATKPVGLPGDSILDSCAHLRRLRELRLCGTNVTSAGLWHLQGLDALETLNLEDTNVSGPGLDALSKLPALSMLLLDCAQITDADLKYVGRLPNLAILWLAHTPITDEGLAHLGQLEKLEILRLDRTAVSDKGLIHLQAMKNLRDVSVQDTSVSTEGFERLRAALPKYGKYD